MTSRWDSLKPISTTKRSDYNHSRHRRFQRPPSSSFTSSPSTDTTETTTKSWRKNLPRNNGPTEELLLEKYVLELQQLYHNPTEDLRCSDNKDRKSILLRICEQYDTSIKSSQWKLLAWILRVFQQNNNDYDDDDDNDHKDLERRLIHSFQMTIERNVISKNNQNEIMMMKECISRSFLQIQNHWKKKNAYDEQIVCGWLSSFSSLLTQITDSSSMSPEWVVHEFVTNMLSNYHTSTGTGDDKTNNRSNETASEKEQHILCECIKTLLQSSLSSQAMMAPLILDIQMENGKEVIQPNPNLQTTFEFLYHRLRHTCDNKNKNIQICTCLIILFTTMKKQHLVTQNTNIYTTTIPIDTLYLEILQSFLHATNEDQETRVVTLKLIHTIMDCFPQNIIQHWHTILPTPTTNNNFYPIVHFISYSDHTNKANMQLSNIAIQIITKTIQILPFKLWLYSTSTLSTTATAIARRSRKNSHAFQNSLENRIIHSIQHLIQSVISQLKQTVSILTNTRHDNSDYQQLIKLNMQHLCQLISTIITKIPFKSEMYDNGDDDLTRNFRNKCTHLEENKENVLISSIMHLFHIVTDLFLKQINKTDIMYYNVDVLTSLSNVLINSMGGTETPQGIVTSLPLPIQKWFTESTTKREQSSKLLLDTLFTELSQYTKRRICDKNSTTLKLNWTKNTSTNDANRHRNIIILLNILQRIIQSASISIIFYDDDDDGIDDVPMKDSRSIGCFLRTLNQFLYDPNTVYEQEQQLSLMGLKLYHSFIICRNKSKQQQYSLEENRQNTCFLQKLPFFLLLNHDSKQTRNLILETLFIYGSLSGLDWEYLLQQSNCYTYNEDNSKMNHFNKILQLCRCDTTANIANKKHGRNNANNNTITIQSEACKTVGNIFSSCINSFKNQQLICQLIQDGLEVLSKMIDPQNSKVSHAAVKSMVVFAVGNLAAALKQKEIELPHQFMPVDTLSKYMQTCLDDTNEKVVGNAIRTIGHLFNLVYFNESSQYYSQKENDHGMDDCIEKIVESLCFKIETAVFDVTIMEYGTSTNHKPPKRSWKQRSNTKKHAWGSCRCLSSILLKSTNLSILQIRRALAALISCVRYYEKLNEKITSSAISTLIIIPRDIWCQQSSDDDSAIGDCISVCLVLLHKVSLGDVKINELLSKEVNDLMKKLLSYCHETDIHVCLFKTDLSHEIVEFLYGWMVNECIESRSFELVSTPLQHKNIPNIFTVSLAQKFRSRAAQLQRSKNTISRIFADPNSKGQNEEDIDEEDEL